MYFRKLDLVGRYIVSSMEFLKIRVLCFFSFKFYLEGSTFKLIETLSFFMSRDSECHF